MARPPLPADQRREHYAAQRWTGAEMAPVQAVADTEHGGDLSAAIRALVAEALAARPVCDTAREVIETIDRLGSDEFHADMIVIHKLRAALDGDPLYY